MSTFQSKRCGHCGTSYSYQTSGYGGMQDHNHPDYCQTCAEVVEKAIRAALEPVPVLFEHDWRPTQDITIAEIDRLDDERVAKIRAGGGIPFWRVMSPLFDMERPGNIQHQKLLRHDGRTYRYEWWEDDGVEHGVVYIECEVEISTDKVVGPWDLKDHWKTPSTFYTPGPKPPRKPPTHEFVRAPLAAYNTRFYRLLEDNSLNSLGLNPAGISPEDEERFLANLDTLDIERAQGAVMRDAVDKKLLTKLDEMDKRTPAEPPTPLHMERTYPLVERREFLTDPIPDGMLPIYSDTQPLQETEESYLSIENFLAEPIPDGMLPIYDKEPTPRCCCARCAKYDGCPNPAENEDGFCLDCAAGGPHRGFSEPQEGFTKPIDYQAVGQRTLLFDPAYVLGSYLSIEALLANIDEPNRTACQNLLRENRTLFDLVPGSVHNHQAWEGGYLDHVREVMNIALALYEMLASKRPLPFSLSSTLLVLYLHDVEKPWKYQPRPEGGLEEKPEFVNDKAAQNAFRVAKLAEYGIVISAAEANALRYVEGEMDHYSNRWRVMNELAGFCHACDVLSARLWHDYPREGNDPWTGSSSMP